jgi:transcriptional regulator with PAS, ATPase and Fis domain
MSKSVSTNLKELLKKMDVSLAIIFNQKGDIVWHTGRPIKGCTIHGGEGFCKSYIRKAFEKNAPVCTGDVLLSLNRNTRSESARNLYIKSLLIQQIHEKYYIYIDSISSDCFNNRDSAAFKVIGNWIARDFMLTDMDNPADSGSLPENIMVENGKVKELALKFAGEEDTILLTGETGVGKSHLARLIHDLSGQQGKFVVADATTINEQLFDSVFFGHKKGSFTGAVSDKKGLIDEAREGTLLIDEVSEVPLSFQSKLLRFVDTKKYRGLGESNERTANVRIIVASNKDLIRAVENGEFREDLFFRLNVLTIHIPPLRERRSAIRKLVLNHKSLLRQKKIGGDFWDALESYDWPGNVRELLSVLKRLGILVDGNTVTGRDVSEHLNRCEQVRKKNGRGSKEEGIEELIDKINCGMSFWEAVKKPFIERELKRSEVKRLIATELEKAGGIYKNLLDIFNLGPDDYHRFMRFLHEHRLK